METFVTPPVFEDILDTSRAKARYSSRPIPPHAKWLRAHYATLGEFLDGLGATPPAVAWETSPWAKSDYNASFRGSPSMESACELGRLGWREGGDQAAALSATIRAHTPTARRLVRLDVAGAIPCVPRAVSGDPRNMRRLASVASANAHPVVTLVVHIGGAYTEGASAMVEHAAAACAAIDMLEDAGYRCAVIGALAAKAHGAAFLWEAAVGLKRPESPLDVATMAFAAGHAAMVRRCLLGKISCIPECKPVGYTFGTPASVGIREGVDCYTVLPPAEVPGARPTPVTRFHAILADLQRQGCPGIPEDMAEAA